MALRLTERDDGRRIQVRVGDTIELRLPENAPAGYRWGVDRLDERLVELTETYRDYPGATGSAGVACFPLRVRAPSESVLRLTQRRSWEGDTGALSRFSVEVVAASDPRKPAALAHYLHSPGLLKVS